MAILPITLYGDEVLNKKTIPVETVNASLLTLIRDMFDTMDNADGVGLAANQVGSNKAVFIIDLTEVKGHEKYGKIVFINPKITKRSEEKVEIEEGCLSLPKLRAVIERPKTITISFCDMKMQAQVIEADEYLSRVIQHEYDHLQGIYFTDRLNDEKKKEHKDYLIRIKNREIEADYPTTPKPKAKKKK